MDCYKCGRALRAGQGVAFAVAGIMVHVFECVPGEGCNADEYAEADTARSLWSEALTTAPEDDPELDEWLQAKVKALHESERLKYARS